MMKVFAHLRYLFLLLALAASHAVYSDVPSTNIAVASNFNLAMKSLIKEFEKTKPFRINPSYASSGKLFAQIRYGAPFSIFLSADTEKADLLAKDGLGDENSVFTYAKGQLALWSNTLADSSISVKQTLENLNFKYLAIANPKLAPYGLAAQNTLEKMSLSKGSKDKLVLGENISQTFQFILSKNAELGFVAYSQLKSKIDSGQLISAQYWIVPTDLHTPIEQNAILLQKAKGDPAALNFYQFLKSEQAAEIIRQHGYL